MKKYLTFRKMELRKATFFEVKLFRSKSCGGSGYVLNKYQFNVIFEELYVNKKIPIVPKKMKKIPEKLPDFFEKIEFRAGKF